jgi:adenylate cyclase
MTEKTQRRLAAIVSADVVGYSRLMGRDEAGTLRCLNAHRSELIDPLIANHGGRIVKTMGDGLLLEFPSVVAAVECVVAVQEGMAAYNADIEDDNAIRFRISVHLGDVIVEGDDIFGDGVNVAARMQEIAEPGGIAISDIVHGQVRGKLDAAFSDDGLHEVKNIAQAVHVWRWPDQSGASHVMPVGESDRSSIAVLPFANMSGDPEQEYFSDGMAEDIITDLSKISGLFVVARTSSFTYKDQAVDIRQAGRELGVRYILEGSVRRAGQKVRINAQLIEVANGNHLWAERYDGELEDIFALQDRITERIVTTLAVSLTQAEQDRAMHKRPGDLQAYDYMLRGNAYHHRRNGPDNLKAQEMYEQAIALDPELASAHAGLAWSQLHHANQFWGADLETVLKTSLEHARRAVQLDEGLAKAHMVLGDVYCWSRQYEQSVNEGRIAVALDPSYAEGHMGLCMFLVIAGQAAEAAEEGRKALRYNPVHTNVTYYVVLSNALYMAKQYEEAVAVGEQGVSRDPNHRGPRHWLAAAHAQLGQMDDARRHLNAVLEMAPGLSLQTMRNLMPHKNKQDIEHFLDGLRKAGLPE